MRRVGAAEGRRDGAGAGDCAFALVTGFFGVAFLVDRAFAAAAGEPWRMLRATALPKISSYEATYSFPFQVPSALRRLTQPPIHWTYFGLTRPSDDNAPSNHAFHALPAGGW